MKRAAILGATIATVATAIVGLIGLMGAESLPVAEFLLFPGSMAAWLFKGDTYVSSREFLLHAMAFGVPINAAIGAVLGVISNAVRTRRA